MSYGLREYQQDAHDAVLREFGYKPYWDGERATSQTTVCNLATASGKTVIAAHLTKTLTEQYGARVLFTGDREELLRQPLEKFHRACGIMAALHRGQDHASPNADVVIASIQTLVRRLPPGRPFDVIMEDEAHRNSDSRQTIHEAYPDAKVVGFTATAFRKNMADLSKYYQSVAYELGTFSLIDQGYLTPIKVMTMPIAIDLTSVRQVKSTEGGTDYDKNQVASIMEPHYRAIARQIKESEHLRDRTILAFLPLIKSSIEFAQIMSEEGISTRHCDGQTADRAGVIEAFERGDFQCLCNSQVMSTGVDFIRCDAMLNLAVTKSRVEYRQRAGRIMRLHPFVIDPGGVTMPFPEQRKAAIAASVKPDCIIIDLLFQTKSIGLAGPASLLALNEKDEEAIAERAKKQRTPEELAQISEDVQRAKEEELAEALAEQARLQAQSNAKATLFDARELLLNLHDRDLLNFEPVMPWEAKKVTEKQGNRLVAMGINPESIDCAGLASKMLDAVIGRQKAGMAPVESFAALKAAGVGNPAACTLNDAIRKLGDGFPMTLGKNKGRPLRDVPKSFWNWLMFVSDPPVRDMAAEKHPAAWRYCTKIVFPGRMPGDGTEGVLRSTEKDGTLPTRGTLEIDARTGKLIPGSVKTH